MVLSIKFTSKSIYIVELSSDSRCVKVYKSFQTDMPDGAYQKGVIINTAEVSEQISAVLKENNIRTRKVMVCINGVDTIKKEISLPMANEQHTRGMVENELRKNDLLKNEYLFDYVSDRQYHGEKMGDGEDLQTVDTFLMPKQLIQNYMQTLQRAGLVPVKLKPLADSMDKLARLLELNNRKNITILAYVEINSAELCMVGSDIKNIYRSIQIEDEDLFEENIFILSSKQSIQSSKNQEQTILENLAETISKLIQFHSQSNSSCVVDQILLLGELAQRSSFVESVGEVTGIHTERCSLSKKRLKLIGSQSNILSNYDQIAIDFSRIVGEKKELSFVKQYNSQRSGQITGKDKIPVYVFAAFTIVMTLTGLAVKALDYKNVKEIAKYEKEIEQIITSEQYRQNLIKIKTVEGYSSYNRLCKQYIDTLENTGRLESEVMQQLDRMKPEETEIVSYIFEDGALSINCKTMNQDRPAQFAELATESGYFKEVEYTGFSLEEDIEGNSYYRFMLKCAIE